MLGTLNIAKSEKILDNLIDQYKSNKLSKNLSLELQEAIEMSKSESLKTKYAALRTNSTVFDEYIEALNGGNWLAGRNVFIYNSTAQCVRCHTTGNDGGTVGPALTHIASTLTREQLLQALVDPSTRLSPGYGSVSLVLKGGQEVTGVLAKETETELTLNTSDAEPLVIEKSRIQKRENMPSSMPPMGMLLSKREIRDVVEYLTTLR